MIVCGACKVVMVTCDDRRTVWIENTKTEFGVDVVGCPVCSQTVLDVATSSRRYAEEAEPGVLAVRLVGEDVGPT